MESHNNRSEGDSSGSDKRPAKSKRKANGKRSENNNKENNRKVNFHFRNFDSRKENRRWIILITLLTFLISSFLSLISSLMENASLLAALAITALIIVIGIIFDIIGTAVTAADEVPFHAMASKKIYGAREAIFLIRNAEKVSNFCNDVVGDICGVISGAGATYIILRIAGNADTLTSTLTGLAVTGLIASMTVGGKAIGKTVAISNSNYIIYKTGIIFKFIARRKNSSKANKRKKHVKEGRKLNGALGRNQLP